MTAPTSINQVGQAHDAYRLRENSHLCNTHRYQSIDVPPGVAYQFVTVTYSVLEIHCSASTLVSYLYLFSRTSMNPAAAKSWSKARASRRRRSRMTRKLVAST